MYSRYRLHMLAFLLVLEVLFNQSLFCQTAAYIHPDQFAQLREVRKEKDGNVSALTKYAKFGGVIDKHSDLEIAFDQDALSKKLIAAGKGSKVTIRIQVFIQRKGGKRTEIPVDKYSRRVKAEVGTDADGNAGSLVGVSYIHHDKTVEAGGDPLTLGADYPLPSALISLTQEGLNPGDRVYVSVTDIETTLSSNYVLTVGEFGLIANVTDSFFLVKRLGISDEEEQAGQKRVNFRPAPGVTLGWGYSARENSAVKFLQPGFGFNVSFTDWNEPSFNPATGQFIQGTDANKIEITTGPVFSLFDGALQFTYGWNLNVRSNRTYFGVGFGFFKIVDRLGKLIKQ